MSHFCVLVIGEDVHGQLAPYEEIVERGQFKWYLVEPEAEEVPSPILVSASEDAPPTYCCIESENGRRFMLFSLDGKEKDIKTDADGRQWFWSPQNPDGYWDHYEVGGRFRGWLKVKDGKEGLVGVPNPSLYERWLSQQLDQGALPEGALHPDPRDRGLSLPDGVADQARVCDIDWVYMRNDPVRRKALSERWDLYMLPEEDRPAIPLVDLGPASYYIERYGTKQNYITEQISFWFPAVITADGKWYHRGPGPLHFPNGPEGYKESQAWVAGFWDRFIKDLDPCTLLTVVDCHV